MSLGVGASVGAGLGPVVPGVGTAIGAGVGTLIDTLGSLFGTTNPASHAQAMLGYYTNQNIVDQANIPSYELQKLVATAIAQGNDHPDNEYGQLVDKYKHKSQTSLSNVLPGNINVILLIGLGLVLLFVFKK